MEDDLRFKLQAFLGQETDAPPADIKDGTEFFIEALRGEKELLPCIGDRRTGDSETLA